MIEIYKKGFRLDISSDQIVTFKKSINLNGVQDRYAYSNTFSIDKTANNCKLLDLPELPVGKANTLQNGYDVDVVINSIFLKSQKLKITKESKEKVDIYILFTDAELISNLKKEYIINSTKDFKYKKNIIDFTNFGLFSGNPLIASAFIQTQQDPKYVIEQMPILINVQKFIKKIIEDQNYIAYGDFFENDKVAKYYFAPNSGVYQIYSSGDGFAPSFDKATTAFEFLNNTLAFFNCFASFDGNNRTVVIDLWNNLEGYKTNFKDYSRFFIDYQDFSFQSKLAKKNNLTYSDSGNTFNSFFTNNLSSEESSTYLSSKFGSGNANLFKDVESLTRTNGEIGETSAIRIYKISDNLQVLPMYINGIISNLSGRVAQSVSMRTVYDEFHKDYTDFILVPVICNLKFKYNEILAEQFSLTEVFFLEQLASYWIPLEINFSTKKDQISIKAMMVKRRKVENPILNSFSSVLLDFRQKVVFPKAFLLSMYPMPPNNYDWDEVIFNSYDETKNRLFVNNIFIPSNSLPQAFNLSALQDDSISIEGNLPGDLQPDNLSDSLFIKATDTNGGVSNESFINLKHTGIANLESNFYSDQNYDANYATYNQSYNKVINTCKYIVGTRPNLTDTITSLVPVVLDGVTSSSAFDMVSINDIYPFIKVRIEPFKIFLKTSLNGYSILRLYLTIGEETIMLRQWSSAGVQEQLYNETALNVNYNFAIPIGTKIRVFFQLKSPAAFPNNASFRTRIENFNVDIKTTKTV